MVWFRHAFARNKFNLPYEYQQSLDILTNKATIKAVTYSQKLRKRTAKLKLSMYLKQNGRCDCCAKLMFADAEVSVTVNRHDLATIEHKIPRSKEKLLKNNIENNLVLTCWKCNNVRGNNFNYYVFKILSRTGFLDIFFNLKRDFLSMGTKTDIPFEIYIEFIDREISILEKFQNIRSSVD